MFLPIDHAVERIYSFTPPLSHKGVELDTRTIFYDIYLDRGTRRLYAVGPALLNLKAEIFPLEIYIGKRSVEFFVTEVKKLIFLESKEAVVVHSESVDITLKFRTFETKLTLKNSLNETWSTKANDNRLTISTLQKDNPIVWVKDWILWHCRLYGVKRVVLYDNGSYDQQGLIEMLQKLEPEVRVIFVYWDFPYGQCPDVYAQNGSLNHCRMRFRPLIERDKLINEYCINLDIDEYLVCPHQKDLFSYLEAKLNSTQLYSVLARQVRVPNILPAQFDVNSTLRFFNFRYQYRNQNRAVDSHANPLDLANHKYIFKFGSLLYNNIHNVSENLHGLNSTDKIRLYIQKLPTKLKRHIWWLKCQIPLLRDGSSKPDYHSILASCSELYFFHFTGLTCKWSKRAKNQIEVYDEDRHMEVEQIVEMTRQARL